MQAARCSAWSGVGGLTPRRPKVHAGYGGLWMGTELTKLNGEFLAQVEEVLGKDDKFIIGCGEGLRSLVALDMLCEAGYSQVVWLENGFSATPPGTLPTEGPRDLHLANVGGVSTVFMALAEAIDKAWKAAQPAANAEEGGGAGPPS